jgi:hypothetical protein
MKDNKIYYRILLSPMVFIKYCFLLAALTIFPLPLLVMISFFGLFDAPVVWALKKAGSDVKYLEPWLSSVTEETFKTAMYGHFIGATIYIWGAFYATYFYIKTGAFIK